MKYSPGTLLYVNGGIMTLLEDPNLEYAKAFNIHRSLDMGSMAEFGQTCLVLYDPGPLMFLDEVAKKSRQHSNPEFRFILVLAPFGVVWINNCAVTDDYDVCWKRQARSVKF